MPLTLTCLDSIDYIYKLYESTLKEKKEMAEIFDKVEEKLGIIHPRFLFLSNHVLNIMGFKVAESYTVIGMMGVLKSQPLTAIISFRGTKNLSEWMKNIDFLSQVPWHPLSKNQKNDSKNKKAKVARGFFSLYTSVPPGPTFSSGCHCREPCRHLLSPNSKIQMNPSSKYLLQRYLSKEEKKYGCATYPDGYFSKIGLLCPTSSFLTLKSCDTPDLLAPLSLRDQIQKYEEEMRQVYKVKKFVMTGHSLGGVFAQFVALDLQDTNKKKVFKVMTFGSPRIGNSDFVEMFNDLIPLSKNKRYANIEDTVVNLPVPFNFSVCYAHTGSTKQTFSNLSILEKECGISHVKDIHSVKTYREYVEQVEHVEHVEHLMK